MWAVLAGFFGGRVLRDGRTPDSVKQARWDARQARRAARRAPSTSRTVGLVAWAVVIVAIIVAGLLR